MVPLKIVRPAVSYDSAVERILYVPSGRFKKSNTQNLAIAVGERIAVDNVVQQLLLDLNGICFPSQHYC